MELKEGELYLSISLFGKLNIAAFKNQKKTKPEHPDFVGNGISIWLSRKKAKDTKDVKADDIGFD